MEPLREIRNRLLNGWQLSKMHTFEVAARHQSFALAAEELSLSPSAVSHRINQLEEELGIQLFVRSHRKVELTHEGKRVYWALKSSLDTLNQEILDIKNQELSGTLTLYSRPSKAALRRLMFLLSGFRDIYVGRRNIGIRCTNPPSDQ